LFALTLLLGNALASQQPAPAKQPRVADQQTQVAPGVTYTHRQTASEKGEPWSIHVLRISRREKSVRIRVASGRGEADEMQRELPTAIAQREVGREEQLLGVVNGDYDMAAPYLGISDGLSLTSRRIWTTGKPTWPAFGLRRSGEPVIAVPEVNISLQAGKQKLAIGALNKPLGSPHGPELRLFTREFRATLRSDVAFRAVVIGKLSRALPLQVARDIRGEILQVLDDTRETSIPPQALVVAERKIEGGKDLLARLAPGMRVKLSIRLRMGAHADLRDVAGGAPILVTDGRRNIVGARSAYLNQRHPRTAACYNRHEIIFAVVDGRQPQLSVGMTLEELADLMVSLGCTAAINTDGGGSSVMAVSLPQPSGSGGRSFGSDIHSARNETAGASAPAQPAVASLPFDLRIVNSPSDGRERGRGNAFVILWRERR
jgi:hypothetical protein